MKPLYPVMLNLEGKKVTVIGGGTIATRKINGLLEMGAIITVISPVINEKLKEMVDDHQIIWKKKEFLKEDLDDAFLVIAATDDRAINESVYEVKHKHQLINIVDRPELCSFHVPSVIRRGKLVITVSTGGASPSLAKKIRTDLEHTYNVDYESYIEFLGWARKLVLAEIESPIVKKELLSSLINPLLLTREDRQQTFLQCLEKAKEK